VSSCFREKSVEGAGISKWVLLVTQFKISYFKLFYKLVQRHDLVSLEFVGFDIVYDSQTHGFE
jgi:hypothetical protein